MSSLSPTTKKLAYKSSPMKKFIAPHTLYRKEPIELGSIQDLIEDLYESMGFIDE